MIGRKIRTVFPAWVKVGRKGDLSARMLPDLAAVVPMEAKLREFSGDLAGLFFLELNPNPIPNHLGNFPKFRGLGLQKLQNPRQRQRAVKLAFL